MTLLRRSILVLMLVCLGCSAQLAPAPPDLIQKIERQVRANYSIPASVKITVGPLRPSDFANYDALTITMEGGEDVFVHFSAILDNGYKTLNEGEAVAFECQQGPKGLNAANVVRSA